MKRYLLAFALVLSILLAACLSACNKPAPEPETSLKDNVSLRHEFFYIGATENFSVQIEHGVREKVFVADGKADATGNFSEISVKNLSGSLDGAYSFEIRSADSTIVGPLTKNVFGSCLSSTADLTSVADRIEGFTLICGETRTDIPISNLLKDAKSWNDALTIAEKEFAGRIAETTVDGVLPREIYVKIVSDGNSPDAPYFWYVSFIGADRDFWALLLDPKTGTVISKK